MIMKPLGGRGNLAPYQTTHVRVPVAVKPLLEAIIADYRQWVAEYEYFHESQGLPKHLEKLLDDNYRFGTADFNNCPELPDVEEAKQIAQAVLRQKQSARKSLGKLLTALYKEEVLF